MKNVNCPECRGSGEKEITISRGEEGMRIEMDVPTECFTCSEFNIWVDQVFDSIPEAVISKQNRDEHKQFFEDAINDIALKNNGHENVSPRFAAYVIVTRYRILKEYPDCKSWAEVNQKIYKHNL